MLNFYKELSNIIVYYQNKGEYMRIYRLLIIVSLIIYIPIQADNKSIKELLSQIAKAPNQDKRVLINSLKLKLKTLNIKERKKAMVKIQKTINNINHNHNHHHHIQPHKCNHQAKFRHLHKNTPHQHNKQEHNMDMDKGRK